MAYQNVFQRYELKYLLTQEQKAVVLKAMKPYMELDQYGRTTIRNVYFDTDNYRLIRRSIERPAYKEKIRVRSYCQSDDNSIVFVELKKKYDSLVYKRRQAVPQIQAIDWLQNEKHLKEQNQIVREIDYFLSYYENLQPTIFLSYEREAYYSKAGDDFRVTFDDHILCRQEDLSLTSEVFGTSILEEGKVLMEIKCSGGIPLWMTKVLSEQKIYKTSFSKYGRAYETLIYPKLKENNNYGKHNF